jgi:hypothetical protein
VLPPTAAALRVDANEIADIAAGAQDQPPGFNLLSAFVSLDNFITRRRRGRPAEIDEEAVRWRQHAAHVGVSNGVIELHSHALFERSFDLGRAAASDHRFRLAIVPPHRSDAGIRT